MEDHFYITNQKPRSWHFNDQLIDLENVDFILVNLAFKHTSSHNHSHLASHPTSLTLLFESTFGFVGFIVPKPMNCQSLEKGTSTYLAWAPTYPSHMINP